MVTDELTWAVGELAEMSTAEFDVDELLHRLCVVAARSLEVDGVGVMKTLDDANFFVHSSDPSLVNLEKLQETLQEGPCRDAVATRSLVAAETVAEMRWPHFQRMAVNAGVNAVLAVPLIGRSRVWGTLDLYWHAEHVVTDTDRASARLLANVAVSYLAMAEDRFKSRQAQEQLARQVLHDQLTGLANRGLMEELITHALAASDRRGTLVAVLFVDLDRFKSINDTFGHQTGDLVLQVVARRLQTILRSGDTVGRLSGDEFLILCEDVPDHVDGTNILTSLGNRVREALAEPIRINRSDVRVTGSIGIAVTAEQPSAAEMIHSADLALYEAKAAGRNRVVLHRHAPPATTGHRDLQRQLFQGIERRELLVYYQPIVTPSRTITAVEALIRWQHPSLEMLNAAEFIEPAETSGSIVAIGTWLLRQVMQQLKVWTLQQPSTAPQVVFCNFSPQQLFVPTLVQFLTQSLADHQISPRQIGVEILEADLADPRLVDVLTTLQQNGHPLAVDDFGTGYSSLSRLIDLPVAYVKIDRSLVTKLPGEPRARAMIKAVLALAADLDLTVISEGVETKPQADYLHRAGTDLLQGFYFGRPMPADDITARLSTAP